MIEITISATAPGWWKKKSIVTWRREIPETWEEVPLARRRRYYSLLITDEKSGVRTVVQQVLRLPAWALRAIPAQDVEAMAATLAWMLPRPDCIALPFASFQYQGITYHLPKPKGSNITCLEYPLADEYYQAFCATGDVASLLLLVATICREEEKNQATTLRRGDLRRALHSREEVEDRTSRLTGLPAEYAAAVLMYFSGLKQYVWNTYRTWIFETDDEDDDMEEPSQPEAPGGPDFGWWGIYQEAAEAGLFGTLEQVYQASFHDVAIWLVRQRMKAQEMQKQSPVIQKRHDDDL